MAERNRPAEGQQISSAQSKHNQQAEVTRKAFLQNNGSQADSEHRLKLLQQQDGVQITAG
ncbi:hypothetical protein D3C80_1740080 [compost metagenome]